MQDRLIPQHATADRPRLPHQKECLSGETSLPTVSQIQLGLLVRQSKGEDRHAYEEATHGLWTRGLPLEP